MTHLSINNMHTMFSSSKSIRRDIINYFIKFLAGKSTNGNVLLSDVKQNGRIAKKNADLSENTKLAWNIV